MPDADFDHAKWVRRITQAEAAQAKRHPAWRRSRALYDMSYWEERGYHAETTDPITPVNYTTTFVGTMLAATFARNPKMFIRARRARFERFASKMDDVIEQMDDEQHAKEVYLEILIDAILTNMGWIELGWIPPDHAMPTPDTAEQIDTRRVFEKLADFLKGKVAETDAPPAPIVQQGILDESKEAGQFFMVRRSPYDVLWPEGFHRYQDVPYLILHERLLAEDFFANPDYRHKDLALVGVRAEASVHGRAVKLVGPSFEMPGRVGASWSDQQVVHLYTIWDRRSQTVTTMSKGSPEPHRGPDAWPYFSEGFPFIPLQFNVVPDTPDDASPYGFTDIEPITPQVIEKSNIRTDMVDHRRRSSFVVYVRRGSQTEDDLQKMQANAPMTIIPVEDTSPNSMILSPAIHVPPAAFETESAINSDLDRESGLQLILTDTARAAKFERASVATMAQGNANLKTSYKVDRIEAFLKRVAHYRIGLYWQYMTRVQVGELLGEELPDAEEWPDLPHDPVVARTRVHRTLELKIQPGSTRPIQDDVLDREQFIRFIQTFQAVSPELFKKVDRDVLAKLAKRFRDPEMENVITEATTQDEEEHAQQENQLLLAGHPQVVQGDDLSHLHVHSALTQQPQVQAQMQQHTQAGRQHPLNDHLLGHAQRLGQGKGKGRGRNQQSVQQQAAASSSKEIARKGTPTMSDVQGHSANLGLGSGATKVPRL